MTQTKHTPAPWKASLYKGGASVIKDVADEGMGQRGGHCIAVMSGGGLADDANARLIAAAPELLEALTYAQSAMSQTVVALYNAPEFERRKSEITELHTCINECLAAIAKATGGAA
jgi:hypothetical protein